MTLDEFKVSRELSLTALASLLGFPVSTVHGWLLGKRKPDAELLSRIADATENKVTVAELRPDLALIMQHPARSASIPPISTEAAA